MAQVDAQNVYVAEVATLFPPQGEWTEAHYFSLPESNRKVELANGDLIVSPSPGNRHQAVSMALSIALGSHVSRNKLGAVRAAPFDVQLFPGTIRQPDLIFVNNDHLAWLEDKFATGQPDWVAEIISPGDRELDEVIKVEEYARAGIPEFWLIDLESRTIRIYVLDEDAYELSATVSAGQVARSVIVSGFEITSSEVFGGS